MKLFFFVCWRRLSYQFNLPTSMSPFVFFWFSMWQPSGKKINASRSSVGVTAGIDRTRADGLENGWDLLPGFMNGNSVVTHVLLTNDAFVRHRNCQRRTKWPPFCCFQSLYGSRWTPALGKFTSRNLSLHLWNKRALIWSGPEYPPSPWTHRSWLLWLETKTRSRLATTPNNTSLWSMEVWRAFSESELDLASCSFFFSRIIKSFVVAFRRLGNISTH